MSQRRCCDLLSDARNVSNPPTRHRRKNGKLLGSEAEIKACNEFTVETRKPKRKIADLKVAD